MSGDEYLLNMRADKTYVSKRMQDFDDKSRHIRIANKVLSSNEMHSFAIEKGEHVSIPITAKEAISDPRTVGRVQGQVRVHRLLLL